jgi:hypothetical protein
MLLAEIDFRAGTKALREVGIEFHDHFAAHPMRAADFTSR